MENENTGLTEEEAAVLSQYAIWNLQLRDLAQEEAMCSLCTKPN